jgi:hypothetical protein
VDQAARRQPRAQRHQQHQQHRRTHAPRPR